MKCMIIGYLKEKKGYRLISSHKFIISRDVVFNEIELQTTDKINNILSYFEKKDNQDKTINQRKPNWMERD